MHVHILDTYSHLKSPVHRLPAVLKLFVALAVVITASLLPTSSPGILLVFVAVAGFCLLLVAAACQAPGPFLIRKMLLLEPLALGAALLALLKPNGLIAFCILAARSSLCLFTMILLANTTPLSEILNILRKLRVPAILLTIIALMYRYLYVLLDESHRMTRARASRTFKAGRAISWSNAASVASQLVIRANSRAGRTYAAMRARGWQ